MPDVFERNVHCLLGLPFDAVDTAAAVTTIRDAARSRRKCVFSTPNLNFLVTSLRNEAFRDAVLQSNLSIADGMPIVWVARMLRVPIRERVAGSDVFERLRRADSGRLSIFFFGGLEGVAEAACSQLNLDSPGMQCVGYESPGFGSVEDMSSDETIARINASGADFVVVALGASKGQAWIARNQDRLSAPVISHLGAVLNFVAGTVRRAPAWARRSGLEWLWRMKEEPALWRRYVVDGLALLRLLITRVVPHAWLVWRYRPRPDELEPIGIESLVGEKQVEVHLRGAWVLEKLAPLRECLSQAALGGKHLRLELGQVCYVDSAFIGLVMLASGEWKRSGKRLSIGTTSRRVRRIFRFACADFLLGAR